MAGIKTRRPYHSVVITAPPSACAAALACGDKRILSTQAPRLPLAECDQPDRCRCVYMHYKDRRAGPRREREYGKVPAGLPKQRRQGRGRRESD